MVLIGFCHALLLFSGDIIGAYGLLAVLLAEVLIRARDRTLLILSGLWTVPIVLFRTLEGPLSPLHGKAGSTTDVVQAAGMRVLEWVQGSVVGSIFTLVPAVLLGVWAARRRLLDEPQRHRQFLLRVAVLGVPLAAAGGLPWALARATWWNPPSEAVAVIAGLVRRDSRARRDPRETPRPHRAGHHRARGLRAAVDDLLPAAIRGVRRGAGRLRRWPR